MQATSSAETTIAKTAPKPKVEILWSLALKRLRERIADYRDDWRTSEEREAARKKAEEKAAQKELAAANAKFRVDLFDKTKEELASIVQHLQQKGDPNLKIVVRPNVMDYRANSIVYPGEGLELWLGVGALAFANDVNELAGILSLEMANARSAYERALAQRLVFAQVRQGPDARRRVAAELAKIEADEKKGLSIDEERKKLLVDSLSLMDTIDQQQERDRLEIQTLRQLRINLDVSDATKRRILAAKEAIDRMIAAGFDPWKFFGPRMKMARIEELDAESFGTHLKRLLGIPLNTGETINTEMEAIRTYLGYLEKRKIKLLNQPFRDVPLPARLAALHYLSTGSQILAMRGVAKYYAGGLGAAGGVYAYFLSSDDAKEAMAEKFKDTSGSKIDYLKGVLVAFDTVMFGSFVAAVESISREFTTKLRRRISKFPSRYVDSVQQSLQVLERIKDRNQALDEKQPVTATEILETLDAYQKNALFLMDGVDPNKERTRQRNLYVYLHETPLLSLYRLIHHEERKSALKDPAVQALIEEADELAKVRIAERKGSYDEKRDRRELRKESREALKERLVFGNEDLQAKGLSLTKLDELLQVDNSLRMQRLLYNLLGSVSTAFTTQATDRVLDLVARYLAAARPTDPGKAAVLDRLTELVSLQYLQPANQEKYLKLMDQHFPQLDLLKQPLAELRRRKAEIPPAVYQTLVHYKAVQDLSAEDTVAVLRELVDSARYFSAAKLLLRRLDKVLQHQGHDTYALVSEILARAPRDFGNPLLKRALTNAIVLKSMFHLNPRQLTALWSHLDQAPSRPMSKFLLNPLARAIAGWAQRSEPTMGEMLEKLDVLHAVGATRQSLADRLLKEVESRPLALADVDAILERDHLWRHFAGAGKTVAKGPIEEQIIAKYEELSAKYPAFLYDPKHSEQVQKVLLAEFRRHTATAQPPLTTEEMLGFWERLVSRGATGVTDGLFEELFTQLKDPQLKKSWADKVFNEHLLWDKNISGRLYKELNADSLHGQTLENAARESQQRLLELVRAAPSAETPEARTTRARELLAAFSEALHFPTARDAKQEKRLRTLIGRMTESPEAYAEARQTLEKELTSDPEAMLRLAKFGFLEKERKKLIEQFADGGPTLVDLLDWTAKQLQTNQEQTQYVKKQITAAESLKGDDLGYSVVNAIVEEAVHWEKEEKWALIRWLRGSAPPPPHVREMFGAVGDETVRRLYSGMPLHVRRVFVAALLDPAKNSLLRGSQRLVYQEQLLNELLPANQRSAEIAQDLLRAFLKSVDVVSSPEKRTLVLSLLLANHQEGGTNAGVVLRNVLEAYGPVGVKFGQLLAASDVLPEAIRQELAKLRDGANEPRLYEIYEDLQRILKVKNTDPLFRVIKLLGSASMKYGILVEPKGEMQDAEETREHVLQVKREETRVSIPADLKQLQLMIDDLVKSNPSRYAFLQGIGSAVQDAIIRELSLVKETQKSAVAKQLYEGLDYAPGVDTHVPATTSLVDRLPGPKARVHSLRSSVFINGKTIDQFPEEEQRKFARVVLATEDQVLFPEKEGQGAGRRTDVFDSDRHPGNILVDNRDGRIQYSPFDWGQLLDFLTPELRERVVKLMAFAQLLEHFGPQDALLKQMGKDLGLDEKKLGALQADLYRNFPNRQDQPRSALGGYYFLLAQLEKRGFEKNVIHYDFLRAIYQLEAYEGLLRDEPHRSPKESFSKRVEVQARALAQELKFSDWEKLKLTVRRPWVAMTVKRNAELAREGKLELNGFLAQLGLSRKAADEILRQYPSDLQTAEEFLGWFAKTLQEKAEKLSGEEQERVRQWLDSKHLESLELSALSAEQFLKSATAQAAAKGDSQGKLRKLLAAPPIPLNPVLSVGNIYAAELVNAIFWSIWERSPELARSWLRELMTLEKHLGFGAFAVAATVYERIFTRAIPMSLQFARYTSSKGGSVAIGMIAADVARRLFGGQRVRDVADEVLTADNLKDVGYGALTFMAADAVLSRGTDWGKRLASLGKPRKKEQPSCNSLFRDFTHLAATFIVAEGIHRATRPWMEEAGLLKPSYQDQMRQLKAEYMAKFGRAMQRLQKAIEKKDLCEAYQAVHGEQRHGLATSVSSVRTLFSSGRGAADSISGIHGEYAKQLETLVKKVGATSGSPLEQWKDAEMSHLTQEVHEQIIHVTVGLEGGVTTCP